MNQSATYKEEEADEEVLVECLKDLVG